MMNVFIFLFTIYVIPSESLKCYESSGQTDLIVDCSGKCMVYRNQYDNGRIVRHCCTNDCGIDDGLRTYEGRLPAYFCSADLCNGGISDGNLPRETIDPLSTITPVTLAANDVSSQMKSCYDCIGHNSLCGIDESTLFHGCKTCMIYLNTFDSSECVKEKRRKCKRSFYSDAVIRRCCTSNCGSSGSIIEYEDWTGYSCSSDRCNRAGTTLSSTSTKMTSFSSTLITTTVTRQGTFQCYDCSGPDCGQDGSALSMNCPMCMVYRNPDDQSKTERRCCWSNCGSSYSVSMYNGIQTYFCSYDKCNGYGAENILNPPVTRSTTSSTTITSTTTTTTSSSASCTLNCRNGGILETVTDCFCYCPEKTNGRECENIDCVQPDDNDPDICIPDNQSLCQQSEIFTFSCLHLCGLC